MARDRRFRAVPEEKRSAARFLARMVPGAAAGGAVGFVPPMRPSVAKAPPGGAGLMHEILFEGLRVMALVEPGRLVIRDADGGTITERVSRIADAVRRLPVNRIVLDGVVIVQDAGGRSDPAALHRDLAEGRQERLVLYVVDLLHLDGFVIADAPLAERKRVLKALLDEAAPGAIAFSEGLATEGRTMIAGVAAMGLAGIVSKRVDSPYVSGPSKDWRIVRVQAPARAAWGPV